MNYFNLQSISNNNQRLMELYREYCKIIYQNNMMMNPNQNFFGFNNCFLNPINYNCNFSRSSLGKFKNGIQKEKN
jgi:hypothetical protein